MARYTPTNTLLIREIRPNTFGIHNHEEKLIACESTQKWNSSKLMLPKGCCQNKTKKKYYTALEFWRLRLFSLLLISWTPACSICNRPFCKVSEICWTFSILLGLFPHICSRSNTSLGRHIKDLICSLQKSNFSLINWKKLHIQMTNGFITQEILYSICNSVTPQIFC